MKFLRTLVALILRTVLFIPLTLLAHLFDGLEALFGRIADGLFDAAKGVRQITAAPYVKEWEKQLSDMNEADRKRALKGLQKRVT